MGGADWHHLVEYLAALGFTSVAAQLPILLISRRMWADLVPANGIAEIRRRAWHPALVGMMERSLYVIALRNNAQVFIAAWLAMKVAGGWKQWSEGVLDDYGKVVVPGRHITNVFLVGNGLSLAFAFAGFRMLRAWYEGHPAMAATIALTSMLTAFGIYGFVWWCTRSPQHAPESL